MLLGTCGTVVPYHGWYLYRTVGSGEETLARLPVASPLRFKSMRGCLPTHSVNQLLLCWLLLADIL